jgi:cytochrome c
LIRTDSKIGKLIAIGATGVDLSFRGEVWRDARVHRRCAMILAAVVAAIPSPSVWAHAAGDTRTGKSDFVICSACHSLVPGKNGYGPTLHGLFGRKAGSVPGYNYSPAMKKSDVVWSDATLFKYLANPKAFIPGDKMPFPGIADAQQRRDLIAYLRQATK